VYQLQPQLFDQKPGGGKKARGRITGTDSDPKTRRLLSKVAKIESDILFDRDAAEIKWLEKLNDLRRESTFIREKERTITEKKADTVIQPTVPEDTGDFVMVEAGESGDEALLGSMFTEDISDESLFPQDATNACKYIRSFEESVGGTSPLKLLQEVCQARYVFFSFFLCQFCMPALS
jgi:ATP-dependent RNA helicase DHX29